MSTNNLTDQIKQAQKWQSSRYQIDKELLEKGYDPGEIENAWQASEVKSSLQKKPRILQFILFMVLYTGIVIFSIAIFHLPAIIISSLSFVLFPILGVIKNKKI